MKNQRTTTGRGTRRSRTNLAAIVAKSDDAATARRRESTGKRSFVPDPLTPRESDVLRMLARGLTYDSAATSLNLSINTVRTHVRSIYEKLEVTSKTEAVLEGLRRGLTL